MTLVATVDIRGDAELERKLVGMDRKVARKVTKQSLRLGAKVILAAVKEEAPTVSGKLKRSAKVRVARRNRRGSFAMIVSLAARDGDRFYGAYVHLGHFAGTSPAGQKAQHKSQGRRKVTSDPFVRRAFDRSKGRAVATVLSDLRRRVEIVGRERA